MNTVYLPGLKCTVLARTTPWGLSAFHYANRTQANARAAKIRETGVNAVVIGHHPFYVRIDQESANATLQHQSE